MKRNIGIGDQYSFQKHLQHPIWGWAALVALMGGQTLLPLAVVRAQSRLASPQMQQVQPAEAQLEDDGPASHHEAIKGVKGKNEKGEDEFFYDANNNLVKATDMEGAGANYSYNASVAMTQIETARGVWNFSHLVTYHYGGPYVTGWKINITDPTGKQEEFLWSGHPDHASRTYYTDKRGKLTRYETAQSVGNSGKITKIVAPDGSATTLTYGGFTALPKTVTDAKGRTSRMTYNRLGRVTSATDAKGRTTTFAYAANGVDLLHLTNSRGQKMMAATYNAYHQPESVTQDPDNLQGLTATSFLSYTAWGAPQSASDAEGNDTTFSYDAASKRLLSIVHEGATLGSFSYDAIDQLTSEQSDEAPNALLHKTYVFDAMGNRTGSTQVNSADSFATSYTPNKLNQLTNVNATWGGGANTSASSLLYDASGNLSHLTSSGIGAGAHTEYSYDDGDRLTEVVKKHPATQANESKSEFVYDGLSRLRISREYSWNGTAWQAISEKRRIYDGMDVIEERDGANVTTASYTRDGNIGGILSKRVGAQDFFFHYDGGGNVVGLSDANQTSVAEYSYDAWGNTLSATGAQASANLYRFSTKELHPASGFYNYGFRFYSSGLGRWVNRDPIGEDGGLNIYAMAGNNPANMGDDYGLLGIKFGENGRNIGIGEPTLIFNSVVDFSDDTRTGMAGLASAFTFGLWKTGHECDPGFNTSYALGSIARDALIGAATMGGGTAAGTTGIRKIGTDLSFHLWRYPQAGGGGFNIVYQGARSKKIWLGFSQI